MCKVTRVSRRLGVAGWVLVVAAWFAPGDVGLTYWMPYVALVMVSTGASLVALVPRILDGHLRAIEFGYHLRACEEDPRPPLELVRVSRGA